MAQPYVGEIRMFAGNFAPSGWMFCEGQLLPISEFETLFNLIGTTYGGDGQSTFALPDLRGRVPVHFGNGFTLAETGGTESVTLTSSQIPSHSHTPLANSSGGSDSASGNVWANSTAKAYSASATNTTMNAAAVSSSGGSQPHSNFMQYLVVDFIISMFGIFPSQT
ncbi:MAG: tail fiber protein [Acidobacteriia bacterium]|nr:tail fiber protein [Terriglobia bacterium]